ncbi:WXG100 family type VII secretion target [Streptomyces mirabilis]|uniref:WXG100 family type VII secretion target n=1 Tax=Streptomyces mirabilis TaxID=68239 RepID=UPI000A97373F|nr:WXG100 family type VII secretion target [Streptomyces mirabilis]MCX4428688.1 WXG100 family type VII secretion target [Streptomyces mirabilis]
MAEGTTTTVDVAGMRAALPHFEQALAETASAFTNMQSQATTLESSWKGDAGSTFISALNTWLEHCDLVKKELQTVTEKLEATTGSYDRVHTSTADSARALQQAVGAGLPGF